MSTRLRISRTPSLAGCALAALLLTVSCHDSSPSPTSPGNATVMGTVIRGSGTLGATTQGTGIGLPQVTVRVVQTGRSTQTDASGDFTLMDVPVGNVEFEFSRSDIHALTAYLRTLR